MRYILVLVLVLGLVFLSISCGDKGVPPDTDNPEAILEIISGNDQSIAVKELENQARTDSLIVVVKTILGQPIPFDIVTFTQISKNDGGSVVSQADTTDTNGHAFTRFIVDSLIGVDTIKVVSEKVGDDGAVFFVINTLSGPGRTMIKIGPTESILSAAGEPIAEKFIVKVLDQYGNPANGQIVQYRTSERCVVETDSSTQDPPEIDTAFTATDIDGLAYATWILAMNPFFNYPAPHQLVAHVVYNDLTSDSAFFNGQADDPGVLEYYHDIRPIFVNNCISGQCHDTRDGYQLDLYFTLFQNDNLIPGDSGCELVRNSRYFTHLGHTNMVEEDKVKRWVEVNNAAPGSSGLNNYNDQMKSIIDMSCVTCHVTPLPANNYIMSSHVDIRGNGSDSIPNAIPGADTSLVVEKMQQRHQWNSLDPDSETAAVLADSIITWIVDDFMRQY